MLRSGTIKSEGHKLSHVQCTIRFFPLHFVQHTRTDANIKYMKMLRNLIHVYLRTEIVSTSTEVAADPSNRVTVIVEVPSSSR
jgi:hypothetical protein